MKRRLCYDSLLVYTRLEAGGQSWRMPFKQSVLRTINMKVRLMTDPLRLAGRTWKMWRLSSRQIDRRGLGFRAPAEGK